MKNTFKAFMQDEEAWDMYITGAAGTGKTTSLKELLSYCEDKGISTLTVAYTHKACGILRSVLPERARVQTLHSFLQKRPIANEHATRVDQLSLSKQQGVPTNPPRVLFLDEYSMVGEKDWMDLQAVQDPNYSGLPRMKVVYIGDPNQLPPVGEAEVAHLKGAYHVELATIHRQASTNPLLSPLSQLVSYITGATPPAPLETNSSFMRGLDLYEEWKEDKEKDKVMLAYTNKCVQEMNAKLSGRSKPKLQDELLSPTTRHSYTLIEHAENVEQIVQPFFGVLELGSKYKTLEHLLRMPNISYGIVYDHEVSTPITIAYVFGHYDYQQKLKELGGAASAANKQIEDTHHQGAAGWAKNNPHTPLARGRAKAWRDYLTFKDCVICLDFPYAMTVHKSQGSTYKNVYLNTTDLAMCAERDYKLYLRLMYVAISRASSIVKTN